MASILIEKLIDAAMAQKAGGLVLAVGYPPTLFLHDEMVELQTKPLIQEDVTAAAEHVGFTLSHTEADRTFIYRDTCLHVSKSADRLIVRLRP